MGLPRRRSMMPQGRPFFVIPEKIAKARRHMPSGCMVMDLTGKAPIMVYM